MFTHAEIAKAKFVGAKTRPTHFWAKCRVCGRTRSFRTDDENTYGWVVDVTKDDDLVIICNKCVPKREVNG